jgi:drug/metabolite transporter (DMT)-like permease
VLATVLLALAASACWGTSDFTSGFKARTVPLPVVLMMSQGIGLALATILVLAAGRGLPGTGPALASLGAGVCAVVGLGCFYRALATGTMSIVAPIAATGVVIPVLALAGVLDFAATGLYGLANRHGQLSIVAVAGSLYPVATVLLARAILSERVVRLQALGVGLALAGVALIAA